MCRCTFVKDGRQCLLQQHTSEVRHCMVGPGGWLFDPPNPPLPSTVELHNKVVRARQVLTCPHRTDAERVRDALGVLR